VWFRWRGGSLRVTTTPVSNKIYVANRLNQNMTIIDGATNTTTRTKAGDRPLAVAVDPVISQVYVANQASSNVTILNEQARTRVPIFTSIIPTNPRQTPLSTAFTFKVTDSFRPFALPVQKLYFQIDTWQGAWAEATGSAPEFRANIRDPSSRRSCGLCFCH
jgi:YVTN family beta-propeller protein